MLSIRELERDLARAWKAQDHRLDVFPEIAERALREAESIELSDLLDAMMGAVTYPDQGEAETAILLASNGYFEIGADIQSSLVSETQWSNRAGAQRIVSGELLRAAYRFTAQRAPGTSLQLGEYELLDVARGTASATFRFNERNSIFRDFALKAPTAFLFVRTKPMASVRKPYPPHVTLAGRESDWTQRERQLILMLSKLGSSLSLQLAREVAAGSHLGVLFAILIQAAPFMADEQIEQVLDAAAEQHGSDVEFVRKTLAEARQVRTLQRALASSTDPANRYVWALLIAGAPWGMVRKKLREWSCEPSPEDVVARWCLTAEPASNASTQSLIRALKDLPETTLLTPSAWRSLIARAT